MADPERDAGAPEGDPLAALVEAGLLAERRPIAAVPLRKALGDHAYDMLVVVCDDGACFQRAPNGGVWLELEPVPGTARALTWEPAQ